MSGTSGAENTCPFPDERSRALYEQALARAWSADDVLDWDRISFRGLAPVVRNAMAAVYGDVLYAESFGVGVTERIGELAPEGWMREFARTQMNDEVRHTAFFTRLSEKLNAPTESPAALVALGGELERVFDYEELLLHAQIVETAARVIFVSNGTRAAEALVHRIRLPGADAIASLLRVLVEQVGRDESRHIAFGAMCLRRSLRGASASRRHALEQRAMVSARLMHSAFAARSKEFHLLGESSADVLSRTWRALRQQLGRLELDIGEAPSV